MFFLHYRKAASIDNLQSSCSALEAENLEKYLKGNIFLVTLHLSGLELYLR